MTISTAAFAVGGPSGTKVEYTTQGELGEVVNNPYDIAPLTSVIRNGGYVLLDAHVKIVPKKGGQVIEYDVGSPRRFAPMRAFRSSGSTPTTSIRSK